MGGLSAEIYLLLISFFWDGDRMRAMGRDVGKNWIYCWIGLRT